MHEFPVIDSAVSIEKLRLRLKANELEQYGDPFTPEFVYEVIRRLPRFSSMRVCNPRFEKFCFTNFNSEGISRMQRSSWGSS